MKRIFLIFSVVLIGILTGCDKSDDYIVSPKGEVLEESSGTLKAASAFMDVPYLSQADPSGSFNNNNCGQTCVTMIAAYFNNYPLNSQEIINQNQWLVDQNYQPVNGYTPPAYNTGESAGMWTVHIKDILRNRHNLSAISSSSNRPDRLIAAVLNNKPCIASVILSSDKKEGLVASLEDGVLHWVVVVGYDSGSREILINDPGRNNHYQERYNYDFFKQSFANGGGDFVSTSK